MIGAVNDILWIISTGLENQAPIFRSRASWIGGYLRRPSECSFIEAARYTIGTKAGRVPMNLPRRNLFPYS
jgi:hypothetical protein